MTTEPADLHIGFSTAGAQAQYTFTLALPNRSGLSQERSSVPTGVRSDVAGPPTPGTSLDEWVRNTGETIVREILPESTCEQLSQLDGHLTILTEDDEVPWELALMHDGHLARRLAVARLVNVATSQRAAPVAAEERPWMRVLLVTNPRGDLEASEAEGGEIRDVFEEEPFIRVTWLNGETATWVRVRQELRDQRFDIFHYAGHVTREPDGSDYLQFFDEPQPAGWLANLFRERPPEMAFINGCQSGRPEQTAPSGQASADSRRAAGMAQLFLRAGVRAYIGTLWDVPDSAASTLAQRFYRDVVAGATIGAALLSARNHLSETGTVAWAAYVLFGRPDHRLQGMRQAIERRENLSRLLAMMARPRGDSQRTLAAIRLGEEAYPQATGALVDALDDDSPAVVWRAVLGLAKIGTDQSLQALVDRLANADRKLALQILVSLRARLSTNLTPAIRALVDDESFDRVVRANALITLGGTADPVNVDLFARYLEGPDKLMQLLALEGLSRLTAAAGDRESNRHVSRLLDDYQPQDDQLLLFIKQRLQRELE